MNQQGPFQGIEEPSSHQQEKLVNVSIAQAQLIKAFQILSNKSPTNSDISLCHGIIGQHLRQQYILELLFKLIEKWSNANETVTKLVITQISTYVKKQTSFGCERRHNKQTITKLFISFFLNNRVNLKFRRMCEVSYMNFLFASQNQICRKATIQKIHSIVSMILASDPQCVTSFTQYCKYTDPISIFVPPPKIITERTLSELEGVNFLVKCLLQGGTLGLQELKSILVDCCSLYLRVMIQLMKAMAEAVKQKDQTQLFRIVQACTTFMEVWTLLYLKADNSKCIGFKDKLFRTSQAHCLVLIILNISSKFDYIEALEFLDQTGDPNKPTLELFAKTLPFTELLLVFQGTQSQTTEKQVQKAFDSLNNMKERAFEILINSAKGLSKKKNVLSMKPFQNLVKIIGLAFQKTSILLTKQIEGNLKAYESGMTNKEVFVLRQSQDLYSRSLKFLGEVVKIKQLYGLTESYRNGLLFKVCLPLLISRKQHDRFEAEDYLFFRQDILNKQNLSYIQNSVAKVIEDYFDETQIYGTITTVVEACMNLVSFSLTANPSTFQALPTELRQSWVLEHYNFERQIQGALTLISIQSYLAETRNDLVLNLQKWLCKHQQFFLRLETDFRVVGAYLLLYSYFCDNFYTNLVMGNSGSEQRLMHRKVLIFCCKIMDDSYDFQKRDYKGKAQKIKYLAALNCLNNSFNHIELFPALYYEYPSKKDCLIPPYMGEYANYPFFPIQREQDSEKFVVTKEGSLKEKEKKTSPIEKYRQQEGRLLLHYRQLGVNNSGLINKGEVLEMMGLLSRHLECKANIQILQIWIESFTSYLKFQIEHKGSVINIPVLIRDQFATQIAIKLYSLLQNKSSRFPNRSLFESKASQLLYLVHCLSLDHYYVYSLGLNAIWLDPSLWTFACQEEDTTMQCLLKCTDLVVRMALKHYSSQKGVDVAALTDQITDRFCLYSFQYLRKVHKYNRLFGILLNLILLQKQPNKMFDFLYFLLHKHFLRGSQEQEYYSNEQSLIPKKQETTCFPLSTVQILTKHSLYLFLVHIYRNPQSLTSEKVVDALNIFGQFAQCFSNKDGVVRQFGEVNGKVLTICLVLIEKELSNLNMWITQGKLDGKMVSFLWRNILFSSKIYVSSLEKRIVALKGLSVFRKAIAQNHLYPDFTLEKLQELFRTVCSCIYYVKNKETLMMGQSDDDQDSMDLDFEHDGDQESWENSPITTRNNEVDIYIEDEVLYLKNTSRQLLSSHDQKFNRQWFAGFIKQLPIAIQNFLNNKVLNYQADNKYAPLRRIVKVKRDIQPNKQTLNVQQKRAEEDQQIQ